MKTKTAHLEGIGPVQLVKHRRAKRLRLRITPQGSVVVTLPQLAPYQLGVKFALSHQDWIIKRLPNATVLSHGDRIGQAFTIVFQPASRPSVHARVAGQQLRVSLPMALDITHPTAQAAASKVALRALRVETNTRLVPRLYELAALFGYRLKGVKVKDMTSRWGSCSSLKQINLSIYLAQLPAELADYVLVHELVHLDVPNHSARFWSRLESHIEDVAERRKRLRSYSPALQPNP